MLHSIPAARPPPSASPQPHPQPRATTPSSSSAAPTTVPVSKRANPSPVKAAPRTPNHPPPSGPTGNVTYHDPDGAGFVNRWSESTASSRRSSANSEILELPPPQNLSDKRSNTPGANPSGPLDNNIVTTSSNAGGMAPSQQQSGQTVASTAAPSGADAAPTLPAIADLTNPTAQQQPGSNEEISAGYGDLDFFGDQFKAPRPGSMPHAIPNAPKNKDGQTDDKAEDANKSPSQSRGRERRRPPGGGDRSQSGKGGEHKRRGSSQKTMLSKALQKANTAVLLDNAANYEGAIQAYDDACRLLEQVMQRTGGGEEKQKLQEIRTTYATRVRELRYMGLPSRPDDKALPERPLSDESYSGSVLSPQQQTAEGNGNPPQQYSIDEVGTATVTRIIGHPAHATAGPESNHIGPPNIPPRRQSLLPSSFDEKVRSTPGPNGQQQQQQNAPSDSSGQTNNKLRSPTRKPYSPPPESVSSDIPALPTSHPTAPSSAQTQTPVAVHTRDMSELSTSWLDTIDESGGSSASSVRSRSSSLYLRRRGHNRDDSAGTEAEFDAALDAAVEAAYDQGLEPATDSGNEEDYDTGFVGVSDGDIRSGSRIGAASRLDDDPDTIVSNARRNVELAKQRVREAEKEAAAASAKEREKRRLHEEALHGDFSAMNSSYDDYEAEEEERILEEMMDDFEFDMQSKSALPRQSGSSSFSGRTGGSSVGSNMTTAGTSLSTLAEEEDVLPSMDSRKIPTSSPPPKPPAPTSAPPVPPVPTTHAPVPPGQITSPTSPNQSVRARRLSGQTSKDLVIDTSSSLTAATAGLDAPRSVPPTMAAPPTSPYPSDEPKTSVPRSWKVGEPKPGTPVIPGAPGLTKMNSFESPTPQSPTAATLTKTVSREGDSSSTATLTTSNAKAPTPTTPFDATFPQNNKIPRPMQVSIPTDGNGHSPSTPATGTFPHPDLKRSQTFGTLPTGQPAVNFFDTDLHSPTTPGSPNTSVPDAPAPLEPCPKSFLLRPFWLMRCTYDSISHPRGGYLTTKLFVPREIWRVKNVKLKAVDEKISNCDLLTAALLKLAKVDMYDADAVLEEMQSLEGILDQVQTVLSKKLGNEVGVQGSMPLFKGSQDDTSPMADQPQGKSSSGGSKSYLTSWRKLRSKNSGNTSAPSASQGGSKEGNPRETLTLNSLPMTENTNARTAAPRSVTELQCTGPNANYMSALARLCDAAQVLEQIVRQVEDPGLRHSSQTLVGLELSCRHAAEFFGFYVCRFVLHDVCMMMDKFIKRGSEWVLA